MSTLKILIGLPASGKTSFTKMYASCSDVVINSSDAIREELTGSAENQDVNNKVFELMFKRTVAALNENKDVIYDATNLNRKRRINLIKQVKKAVKNTELKINGVVFAVPYETCLERNNARDRKVPEEVIKRMMKSFEPPSLNEGFDSINIVNKHNLLKLNDYFENICDIPHDNHHHRLTIKGHLHKAYEYALLNYHNFVEKHNVGITLEKEIIFDAVKYHDIGKSFCKVFHNAKGESTEEAHFYNHENVSAYIYLCYSNNPDALFVANLIYNHMIFYADEKSQEKRREFYGEEFWTILQFIHEADMAAH